MDNHGGGRSRQVIARQMRSCATRTAGRADSSSSSTTAACFAAIPWRFGSAAANFEEIGSAIGGLPGGTIESYRIVRGQSDLRAELRDTSGLAHAAYGLFEGGVVLVRPDGYVGYRNKNFDLQNLRTYLARIFAHTSQI